MKIVCERDRLDAAIDHVIGRTKSKVKIPILTHILLEAGDGRLQLTATDLEAESRVTIPAEIQTHGATAIPGDQFDRLVSGFAEGAQIIIEATKTDVTLRSGRARYRLPTLLPADWPSMSSAQGESAVQFSLSADIAKRMFSVPQPAVGITNDRMYLQGGYLHRGKAGHLSVVATNGHALLRISIDHDVVWDGAGFIVPKPAMAEIVRLAKSEIGITVSENLITVVSGDCSFSSKLIAATYPDIERIIPPLEGDALMFDREELSQALRRLEYIAKDRSYLRFTWNVGDERCTVTMTGDGDGEEVLADSPEASRSIDVTFAPKLFRSVLDTFTGDTLKMYVGDHTGGPTRIADPLAADLTAIVMPWRA